LLTPFHAVVVVTIAEATVSPTLSFLSLFLNDKERVAQCVMFKMAKARAQVKTDAQVRVRSRGRRWCAKVREARANENVAVKSKEVMSIAADRPHILSLPA